MYKYIALSIIVTGIFANMYASNCTLSEMKVCNSKLLTCMSLCFNPGPLCAECMAKFYANCSDCFDTMNNDTMNYVMNHEINHATFG